MVEEPNLRIITGFRSVYELVLSALEKDVEISTLIRNNSSETTLAYDPIYEASSPWKLLPSFDHPTDPLAVMLSGTGLTHKASAENRENMHKAEEQGTLSDSMKIYLMGLEGGHPEAGKVGVQPEWFYKGNGSVLKAHNDNLYIPAYGDDGGEEPEIVGLYIIDKQARPWRIGFSVANEFSDHLMEQKNYLYLAPSKIRNCAVGPELVLNLQFEDLSGTVSIIRNKEVFWSQKIKSGQQNMSHSLSNLEYHHFKYANHRIPGQLHLHFFGADAFSFGAQKSLQAQDIMQIHWEGMGRPLNNKLMIAPPTKKPLDIGEFS